MMGTHTFRAGWGVPVTVAGRSQGLTVLTDLNEEN